MDLIIQLHMLPTRNLPHQQRHTQTENERMNKSYGCIWQNKS